MAGLGDLFADVEGEPRPGGCDDCNAFFAFRKDDELPSVWHMVVRHDDRCPFMRAQQAGEN